jgi:hypothetical protein
VQQICNRYPSCCSDGGTWDMSCVGYVNTYCNQCCDCSQLLTMGPAFNPYACSCAGAVCSRYTSCCVASQTPPATSPWNATCVNSAIMQNCAGNADGGTDGAAD